MIKRLFIGLKAIKHREQWAGLLGTCKKLAILLIPCWLFIVLFLYLLPIRLIKTCLYPSAWTFNRIGKWLLPFIEKLQLQWALKRLPIYNVLQWMDLGYTAIEITHIEVGVIAALFVEGCAYYLYRKRVKELITFPPQRSNIDSKLMQRLADHFVSDTTAEDIVKFILYAFYCLSRHDMNTVCDPKEDVSDPRSIWHGHHLLSKKYNLEFPLLTRDDLESYLCENLGLPISHSNIIIERISEKIGTKFPECDYGVGVGDENCEPTTVAEPQPWEYMKRPTTPLVNKSRLNTYRAMDRVDPVELNRYLQPPTGHITPCASVIDTSRDDTDRIGGGPPRAQGKSSQQSAMHECCYVYGANDLEPHYRPLLLCFVLHFVHKIVSRILMPLLGFIRFQPLRHDLRKVMRFYVLPDQRTDGDVNSESQKVVRPLLILHGFGLGITPYISLFAYLVKYYAGKLVNGPNFVVRPIIIPEFQWLGLLPNGGITFGLARASIIDAVKTSYTRTKKILALIAGTSFITPEDLLDLKGVVGENHGIREEPSDGVNWVNQAPHRRVKMQKRLEENKKKSDFYLPTMPEVVDEIVSFIRYFTATIHGDTEDSDNDMVRPVCEWENTTTTRRLLMSAITPIVGYRTDYETRSYRNFWMRSPSRSVVSEADQGCATDRESEVDVCDGEAFENVEFLNPAYRPEEVSLSRIEFLTRFRLMEGYSLEDEMDDCREKLLSPVQSNVEVVNEMEQIKKRIHKWFEPREDDDSSPVRTRIASRPMSTESRRRSPEDLWIYDDQGLDPTNHAATDLNFDVLAHSYGTSVASCIIKTYYPYIRKLVLLDPICFIVQLTKKAQLCGLPPWKVKLFDRSYSGRRIPPIVPSSNPAETEGVPELKGNYIYEKLGVHAVDLNGYPIEANTLLNRWASVATFLWLSIPTTIDWAIDRSLLYLYWYGVYRDFGTRWTTGRQLQGHEYIDEGQILALARGGRLMVGIGLKDLIVSSPSVAHNFEQYPEPERPILIVNNDHHGFCLVRWNVLARIVEFLDQDVPASK